eukprot:2556842-Prymnesium_polylepis.2
MGSIPSSQGPEYAHQPSQVRGRGHRDRARPPRQLPTARGVTPRRLAQPAPRRTPRGPPGGDPPPRTTHLRHVALNAACDI